MWKSPHTFKRWHNVRKSMAEAGEEDACEMGGLLVPEPNPDTIWPVSIEPRSGLLQQTETSPRRGSSEINGILKARLWDICKFLWERKQGFALDAAIDAITATKIAWRIEHSCNKIKRRYVFGFFPFSALFLVLFSPSLGPWVDDSHKALRGNSYFIY